MKNKKILMIIAHKDFRDEEYFLPLEIFRRGGAEVTTASSKTGIALGVLGGEAEVTLNIKNAQVDNFDAVVFVGGGGAQEYFENKEVHRIVKEFNEAGKITAAICIAPVILAKAGVLKGRTATVWSNKMDKTGPKALEKGKCTVSKNSVEISENIVTANGREASEEFARKIIENLRESS
ncbi:MAG: DJ-1/PfpI family protein [Candidatus Pacebacteria bacterium]|jgi:protease I|nr:DJ-1/PfpI family protein [Candidatus Paceibacterota bacterium]